MLVFGNQSHLKVQLENLIYRYQTYINFLSRWSSVGFCGISENAKDILSLLGELKLSVFGLKYKIEMKMWNVKRAFISDVKFPEMKCNFRVDWTESLRQRWYQKSVSGLAHILNSPWNRGTSESAAWEWNTNFISLLALTPVSEDKQRPCEMTLYCYCTCHVAAMKDSGVVNTKRWGW